MNRLTRITSILIQLQSKKIVTAKEISLRFDISLRTVYRDIKTLQEAGVPIGSENGVGYFIVEGYHLPPISLTEEEANSLIISEAFIKKQGDVSLVKNFNSLLIKIKATLKSFQKENIEYLSNRTIDISKTETIESRWLSEIQKSISGKKTLQIIYQSIYKKEITKRKIEPQAIYFTNNTWVLIAFCHLRNETREFRLDKIIQLTTISKVKNEHFPFDFQKYLESFQT